LAAVYISDYLLYQIEIGISPGAFLRTFYHTVRLGEGEASFHFKQSAGICRNYFKRKSSSDFLLEGFEEGDDEDDDDEDEGKGGEDGAGLESFESAGPEQNSGGEGLNDAPCEFYVVGWVEAAICCKRAEYEGGGICGGDEKCAD